jgi:hypothetical protein
MVPNVNISSQHFTTTANCETFLTVAALPSTPTRVVEKSFLPPLPPLPSTGPITDAPAAIIAEVPAPALPMSRSRQFVEDVGDLFSSEPERRVLRSLKIVRIICIDKTTCMYFANKN